MAGEIAEGNILLIRPVAGAHHPALPCRPTWSGTIPRRFPSVRQCRAFTPLEIGIPNRQGKEFLTGFTLIELLVVISVIALLLAILLPTVQRVRRQSKAVACQSNLRHWGVVFSMYAGDNNGGLPYHFPRGASDHVWPHALRNYYADSNDLLLCPMATRRRIRPDDPLWTSGSTLRIAGGRSTVWEYRFDLGSRKVYFSGSYGINRHARWPEISRPHPGLVRNSMPVLLDCAYMDARPWPFDRPPEYEDQIDRPGGIKYFCINRHDGWINGLFFDWSVRRIGLKELWTLRWDPHYSARMLSHSPWTTAGGVQPSDWPKWMRRFKDY